jgi:hypothetical protein
VLHASAVGIPARSQEHRPGRIGQPDESEGTLQSFTWVIRRAGGRSSGWRMLAPGGSGRLTCCEFCHLG